MNKKSGNIPWEIWLNRLLKNKAVLAILFCAGIFLMLAPLWETDPEKPIPQTGESLMDPVQRTWEGSTLLAQGQALAAQAQSALGKIQGAGQVQVSLTLERSAGETASGDSLGMRSTGQLEGAVIRGVLITAEGAGDPQVRFTLYEAAAALFGISEHQIFVAEGEAEDAEGTI